MEELADCFAVVGGARLPLHSQVLGAQSAVLRDLFRSRREGGSLAAEVCRASGVVQRGALQRPLFSLICTGAEPCPVGGQLPSEQNALVLQEPAVDLSVAFSGTGVREAAFFLRLMYTPDDASASMGLLNVESLAAVAALAHKLNTGRLLAKIESALQGKYGGRQIPVETGTAVPAHQASAGNLLRAE